MKIIPQSQLQAGDFPKEQQGWIPQLLSALNQFFTSVGTALQQNLTFNDNVLGQEQNLSFVWASASSSLPLKFQVSMSGVPLELRVCAATENKSPVALLPAWQYMNGSISITDLSKVSNGVVSSLVSGASYTMRVRIET